MLRRVHIQNFKSIADLALEPGQVNVLIGENGCGKSNFLEALAFASAAAVDKLDNEFLTSRGSRVTAPEFMRSAFKGEQDDDILFALRKDNESEVKLKIKSDLSSHYPRWRVINADLSEGDDHEFPEESLSAAHTPDLEIKDPLSKSLMYLTLAARSRGSLPGLDPVEYQKKLGRVLSILSKLEAFDSMRWLSEFLIYSPENSALRTFAQEGQVLPLGVKGEGLFKLLRFLSADEERWSELKSNLKMIDWFRDLKLAPEQIRFEQSIQIRDRFLAEKLEYFDQRSANEGFLFLLFYISLMISPDTPSILAIDNIDASLNPKTATALTSRLAALAKKYNKQIFLTTHSPAVLDGLDLTDSEQRLFVFQRNRKGETRCRRVTAPQPVAGEAPVKLSEAFLRGLIGGLPQNF